MYTFKQWDYEPETKKEFHKQALKLLRAINRELNLNADIRSNKAGIACLGEVTLHSDHVYVQIGDYYESRKALIRTCKGKQDYSGDANHYVSVDKDKLSRAIKEFTCKQGIQSRSGVPENKLSFMIID